MSGTAEPQISDQPEASRFVIAVDGRPAGQLDYSLEAGLIRFTHAEIGSEHEGLGLGSSLAAFALDDARARGLAVIPACPFISGYIERHSEYLELVPAEFRPRFGLGDD
ncbi:MAG: N-acetyltransferase [Actinomycetota bacterium]|nr:N-acetyltransferase [Actinomycetota bacterium]